MALRYLVTLGLLLAFQTVCNVQGLNMPSIVSPQPTNPNDLGAALASFNNRFGNTPSPAPAAIPSIPMPATPTIPNDLDAALAGFNNRFGNVQQPTPVPSPLGAMPIAPAPAQVPSVPAPVVAPTASFDLDAALDAFNRRFKAAAPEDLAAQTPLPPSRPGSPTAAPVPIAPEEEEEEEEIPVPAVTPVAPIAAPPTAVPVPQAPAQEEKLKPLTPFGKTIAGLIENRRYKTIRTVVNKEFENGMAKVRKDLARLQARKQQVVLGTSNPDAIDDDLLYLTEIVGDAEKVLTERYNKRKQQFNQLVKISINRRMAKYSPGMIHDAADLIDHIVHDPIAESKKMFRIQKRDINEKMSV